MTNSCVFEVTCSAPVNIAVVKYWGKRDTNLILPTNSSLSATLSQDHLHSKTTVRASPEFERDRIWLNGSEDELNKRIMAVLKETRRLRAKIEAENSALAPLSTYKLHISSRNNFPTAAGLASSASGYACLVFTICNLFQLSLTVSEMSKIARVGSGSACRSLFGGFAAWEMGSRSDGEDSLAVQVEPETHWPEMAIIVLVVNDRKKTTSSTRGMQNTLETSELLQHRIQKVVPERMERMKRAISERDFDTFAVETMRDSNQFHAVCLDTFPPITYMNEISHSIVRMVTAYNDAKRSQGHGYAAAYTFDAGPNAVIYIQKKDVDEFLGLVDNFFPMYGKDEAEYYGRAAGNFDKSKSARVEELIAQNIPIAENNSLKRIIYTEVGDGPRILSDNYNPLHSLLQEDGLAPKV